MGGPVSHDLDSGYLRRRRPLLQLLLFLHDQLLLLLFSVFATTVGWPIHWTIDTMGPSEDLDRR